MKFHRPLEKAIFLQRKCDSLIEAEANTIKMALFCPNHSQLSNCAVLGSRIWYSPPVYMPRYMPATWQLAEVDLGNLVLVNNKLCNDLFLEGICSGIIKFRNINNNKITIKHKANLSQSFTYDFNVIDNDKKSPFYINLVTSTNDYFPEANYTQSFNSDAMQGLYDLIHAKMLGHRVALCCFVLNQEVNKLSLTEHFNLEYARLLKIALNQGVEFFAYKLSISDSEIKVCKAVEITLDLTSS